MSKKQLALIAGAFALLLAGRLLIAGTGYLEDQDEFLYLWIYEHFYEFTSSATWAQCMFEMQGQPPEILIRLLQYISVLPISQLTGLQPLHPTILYFIGLYNIVVSLTTLYLFFRILQKLGFNFSLALTGMLLLGTLFNYNIYTRHILPYEHAFLFQLLAFNILLRQDVKTRHFLLAGFFSAIGLTNYFGSFMMIFINGGFIVLRYYRTPADTLKKSLLFVLPFFLVIGSFELLTRINGKSYLAFLTQYSTTVNMASYDEGFSYIFLYFFSVEKWWGLLLLALFFAGTLFAFIKGDSMRIKQVLFLGIMAYISYGAYVFFSHKMVFHGRVLHIYFPFIIIGALVLLHQIPLQMQRYALAALVLGALTNYAFVVHDFNRIGYPRNAIYKYHLFENDNTHFTYFEEMLSPVHYTDRHAFHIDSAGPALLPPGNYAAGNLCFNIHYPDSAIKMYPPYRLQAGDSLVFEQLHFQSHPGYAFEYCARGGRNLVIDRQLKIKVIKTASPLKHAKAKRLTKL